MAAHRDIDAMNILAFYRHQIAKYAERSTG